MIDIVHARWPEDVEAARRLFREYADGLGVDLCFQGFEEELAALPGKYAPPSGRLLLAWKGNEPMGCVALRRVDDATGEMKRLYVKPSARGERLGKRLVERICDEARLAGYSRVCLDTLPSMTAAQSLYKALGFVETPPYVFNPVPGTQYLALQLR
jgi:ribosomal protein S18 acetylase RimI-like enzyme